MEHAAAHDTRPGATPGDKGGDYQPGGDGVAGERLLSFIERVETLEEEKKNAADGIKEVLAEAKGEGFDVKTLKDIIRMRKQDQSERDEKETLLDIYMRAIGMKTE